MAQHEEAVTVSTWVTRLLGDTEPVRRALYPVVVAAAALLVFYGRLSADSVPLWLALAVGVLGIGGTEVARLGVFAPRTVTGYAGRWEAYAQAEHARGLGSVHEPGELAVGSRLQCSEVRGGQRCVLRRGHDPEGGHLIPTE